MDRERRKGSPTPEGLNSGAVKLNPHELQMLEAKKGAWLKKQETEVSSDDDWGNTTAREAENEVEEQDVLTRSLMALMSGSSVS